MAALHIPLPVSLQTRPVRVCGRILELRQMPAAAEVAFIEAYHRLEDWAQVLGGRTPSEEDRLRVDLLRRHIVRLMFGDQVGQDDWLMDLPERSPWLVDQLVEAQADLNNPEPAKAQPQADQAKTRSAIDWGYWEDVVGEAADYCHCSPQEVWERLPLRHIQRYALLARRRQEWPIIVARRCAGDDSQLPVWFSDQSMKHQQQHQNHPARLAAMRLRQQQGASAALSAVGDPDAETEIITKPDGSKVMRQRMTRPKGRAGR